MIDFHIHPGFSVDAEGSVNQFCEAALKKQMQIICFTTHVDTDPQRNDGFVRTGNKQISTQDNGWVNPYVDSVRNAADLYREEGLEVLLGVEVDYYPGFERNIPSAFNDIEWDYILGAMHLLEHKALSLQKEAVEVFRGKTVEELSELYYNNLIDCVKSGFFDCLAHIDIYRRYGEQFYGKKTRTLWKSHISELADAMCNENVGFEVNTSSIRKGLAEPMPSRELIQNLHDEGVDIVTVGSDAHLPDQVGYEIPAVMSMLKDCGFDNVNVFRKRTPIGIQLA